MYAYVRTKFQVSSIILTSFRRKIILPNPTPTQNEPPKTPPRLRLTWKLFPTGIVHVLNTVCLCISSSVDGQLVELTYWPFITNWGKCYYKMGQLNYDKLGQVYYKSGQLLQIRLTIITNGDSYYKLGQTLLQIRAATTSWCNYYKLGYNNRFSLLPSATSFRTACSLYTWKLCFKDICSFTFMLWM